MTVERAFLLLGIGPECSKRELTARFRKLAKKFHPDTSISDSPRNHERMTLLNLAFETAYEYINTIRGGETHHTDLPDTEDNNPDGTDHAAFEPEDPPVPDARTTGISETALLAIDEVCGGIYTYYQYGLENVHLRNEGAGRFRYREALRKMKKGIIDLERILPDFRESGTDKILFAFHRFSMIFFENVQLSRFFIPSPHQIETIGYHHYRAGGTALDLAIKDLFCPELNGSKLSKCYTSDRLQFIEKELMMVITRYYASSWLSEAMIKIKLYEHLCICLPFFQKVHP